MLGKKVGDGAFEESVGEEGDTPMHTMHSRWTEFLVSLEYVTYLNCVLTCSNQKMTT